VDFLTRLARRALAARDDRVQHHLVADTNVVHIVTNGIDDARAVRAEDGWQRSFGQTAGDEYVEVIERRRFKTHTDLAGAGLHFGPVAQL
jgi:hypothetical protein